tara:strand:+ start:5894 stop:6088 length:195 start_codon:yes stop_codon:yes gene_type:complete
MSGVQVRQCPQCYKVSTPFRKPWHHLREGDTPYIIDAAEKPKQVACSGGCKTQLEMDAMMAHSV